jgi:hypothetical protein
MNSSVQGHLLGSNRKLSAKVPMSQPTRKRTQMQCSKSTAMSLRAYCFELLVLTVFALALSVMFVWGGIVRKGKSR